jgi:hypothetical protein
MVLEVVDFVEWLEWFVLYFELLRELPVWLGRAFGVPGVSVESSVPNTRFIGGVNFLGRG